MTFEQIAAELHTLIGDAGALLYDVRTGAASRDAAITRVAEINERIEKLAADDGLDAELSADLIAIVDEIDTDLERISKQ
jgi:hypothetical protein